MTEPGSSPPLRHLRQVVVLDDDPTGGQTVADVPVVTAWESDDLEWLLTRDRIMGVVLTNSRALQAEQAAEVNRTIAERALAIGRRLGIEVSLISRADSTLRGHVAAELRALVDGLRNAGQPADVVLLAPAFFEAGRVTHDDVHYVVTDGRDIPVADTAYAADPSFGFAESNLLDWVRARMTKPDLPVSSLSLDRIRRGGVAGIAEELRTAAASGAGSGFPPVLVVNATEQADYDLVAAAVARVEAEGMNVLTRCGPSYLASRLGEPVPDPVSSLRLAPGAVPYGLVVVGSHVPLTTTQLATLVEAERPAVVELDVLAVTGPERTTHLGNTTEAVVRALETGHVVLATSRRLLSAGDARAGLDVAAAVSSAVDEVARSVLQQIRPAWIVAKGGITSATMLTRVLDLRRGWIVGQMFRGLLPLWRAEEETGTPSCVIFPGNVGTPRTLLETVRRLGASHGA